MATKSVIMILLFTFIAVHRAFGTETKPIKKNFFAQIASHVLHTVNKRILKTDRTRQLFTNDTKTDLLNQVKKVDDLNKLSKILNRFLKKSNFSCAKLVTKNDLSFHYMKSKRSHRSSHKYKIWHIGIQLQEYNHHYIVQSLYHGYPASKAGLRRGDILLYAQEKQFHPITSFSSGKPVTLTILRQNKQLKITVQPVYESLYDSTKQAIQNSAQIIQTQHLSIGYFHLWTTGSSRLDFFAVKHILNKKLKNIAGLILDIRDGYSGTFGRFTSLFFSGIDQYVALVYQDAEGKQRMLHHVLGPTLPYTGPMVVLINENTFGSQEVLAYLFRRAYRAVLIGTKTKGVLCMTEMYSDNYQNYIFTVPIGTLLIDFVHQIDGIGISPDINISFHPSMNKDQQLQKAIDTITTLIQRRRNKNKTNEQKIHPTSKQTRTRPWF